ncbi:MAG: amidohydrolase family protein [Chloroflexi bacterium]|nr:amidohydrolase family protein [Chloroflexota bacterium]
MSQLTIPGMIDAHVHLREPGASHKEDITSGTTAALAGGVIAVLDMPNNTPPSTDPRRLALKQALFAAKAVSDYGLFVGFDGYDVSAVVRAAPQAVGLKLYLDQTYGNMTTREPASLSAVFEAWPGPGPIAIHAESAAIRAALLLAKRYRQRLHICHVPAPDDLLCIDEARQGGTRVTCEVTPHHLFLSREDEARLGPYGRMKPPLVSPSDRALFWERLHLVDLVASDHAPHTRQEKDGATPPPGVPGLETSLPLLLYAVDQGSLTLERLLELIWHNPLRVYGLLAPAHSAVDVDLGHPYQLPLGGYHTKCGWSPFAGQWATGHITRVTLRGQTVWQADTLLVTAGFGRPLARNTARPAASTPQEVQP